MTSKMAEGTLLIICDIKAPERRSVRVLSKFNMANKRCVAFSRQIRFKSMKMTMKRRISPQSVFKMTFRPANNIETKITAKKYFSYCSSMERMKAISKTADRQNSLRSTTGYRQSVDLIFVEVKERSIVMNSQADITKTNGAISLIKIGNETPRWCQRKMFWGLPLVVN
ncbi:MAG: hypothetical protein JRJ78_15485 [Deltaproteobacteria bacterium]|nr:hypothetical protein [Deltaproteobacteria bacterium]